MDPKKAVLLWLGGQLMQDELEELKTMYRDTVNADPAGTALSTVLMASVLYFEAEKDENPKIQTFTDALVFVATNLSGGYHENIPKTDKGKLITSALQMFGPSMAGRVMEPPAAAAKPSEELETQRQLLAKLDEILTELKARPLSDPSTSST